jgi:hypothetical protein
MQVPAPPRADVNAPDLYIPAMAFVTYILLLAYVKGSQNQLRYCSIAFMTSFQPCTRRRQHHHHYLQ